MDTLRKQMLGLLAVGLEHHFILRAGHVADQPGGLLQFRTMEIQQVLTQNFGRVHDHVNF